ncbi:MAG TPA: hypothetical protein VFD33_04560 [Bacillota bacterium]|nr:hypothetical protein [Bacillota bacterium]
MIEFQVKKSMRKNEVFRKIVFFLAPFLLFLGVFTGLKYGPATGLYFIFSAFILTNIQYQLQMELRQRILEHNSREFVRFIKLFDVDKDG